jgi:hypothetical protein
VRKRKSDADVPAIVQRLASELRSRVVERAQRETPSEANDIEEYVNRPPQTEPRHLAHGYLDDREPEIDALAQGLDLVARFQADLCREPMANAYKATLKLKETVAKWQRDIKSIVDEDKEWYPPTRIPSSALTARVARVCAISAELEPLVDLLRRQFNAPEMLSKNGRPTNYVLRDLTRILKEAGFTHRKIGELVDGGPGDTANRMRHVARAARRGSTSRRAG